jgi:hypothetical protein
LDRESLTVQATDFEANARAAAESDEDEDTPSLDKSQAIPTQPEEAIYQASLESPGNPPIQVFFNGAPSQSADSEIYIHLDLAESVRLKITIETLTNSFESESPADRLVVEGSWSKTNPPQIFISPGNETDLPVRRSTSRLAGLRGLWPYSLAGTLFGLALLLYLATRLIGLADYPIYFFSDEAIQTLHAADLIRDGFQDEEGTFLPTYFKNGPFYNLSLSVYLQVLPYLLFGKSVFIKCYVCFGQPAGLCNCWWADAEGFSKYLTGGQAPCCSRSPRLVSAFTYRFRDVTFVSFTPVFIHLPALPLQSPGYLYLAIGMGALAFYPIAPGKS